MHFEGPAVQGRMLMDAPWFPVADYAMTLSISTALPELSTSTRPQVMLLGLGTGALAWTYHRLLPHAELCAVEIRPAVIDAARARFDWSTLEAQGVRLEHLDALEALHQVSPQSQSLISVDLFLSDGPASLLFKEDFWRALQRALHPRGWVSINAWSSDPKHLIEINDALKTWVCPDGEISGIGHEYFGNIVIFAAPQQIPWGEILAQTYNIDRSLTLTDEQLSISQRDQFESSLTEIGVQRVTPSQRLSRLRSIDQLIEELS